MRQVVIIDGKNQLFRHHFSPSLTFLKREDGFPTGSLFGNLNYVLLGVHKHLPDAAIVWCWDGEGETWRHKMMGNLPAFEPVKDEQDEDDSFVTAQAKIVTDSLAYLGLKKKKRPDKKYGYKANRIKSSVKYKSKYPTDEKQRALIQMPVLKLMLEGIGIRQFEIPSLECDDLIGMLVHKIMKIDSECEIYIFSGDRDFYQLLQYEKVSIIKSTKGGKLEIPTVYDIESEFGIALKDWTEYRAWTGDSSDNIPHLWKVGKVTARKMLEAGLYPSTKDYKDLDIEAVAHFARYFQPYGIEKLWPAVHMNYQLCELVTDPSSILLSDKVKEKAKKAMHSIKSIDDLCRRDEIKTSANYRRLTYLLSQYELASILAQRDELWSLP